VVADESDPGQSSVDPDVSRSALSDGSPSAPLIRVRVPRPPGRGRGRNNVFDESDLVDPLEGFPFLDSDRLVRSTSRRLDRRSRLDTELMDLDPRFVVQFNPAVDSAELEHNLKFDTSVPLHIRNRVVDLVKEFWCVFREDGVPIPIKGYEMVIDTGRHPPCKCRNSNYGPHETAIINKQLQSLEANGFIEPDTDSPFMSRIVLAPKPHQHSVSDID